MLIKILVVIVILLLLRRQMGIFKPFWPLCVGLTVGGLAGWWLATLAVNTGVNFCAFEHIGCPRIFIKPIFALIGALMMVGPISAAIYSLLPPDKKNELR
jgi:hypothetical protein